MTKQTRHTRYNIPHCGLVLDRDINAAKNILQKALGPDEAIAA